MSLTLKLGVIITLIVAVTILIYTAVSDNVFFFTQQLKHDDVVYDEGDRYSLHFYKDGKEVEVAEISYAINKTSSNLATITFQISHKINYEMDSLSLKFKMIKPPSALVLENIENYSPTPLISTPTDDNTCVIFNFSDPKGSEGSLFETFYLDFLLDLSEIDPMFTDKLILDTSFSMHEQSIFKILKYTDQIAVQLIIPYDVQ
jgi:hypothetical protein